MLATVPDKDWKNPAARTEIRRKLGNAAAPGEGSGLGDSFYDLKANFADDALVCWQAHNRTEDCADWRSDAKRLYPDTRADRKDAGLSVKARPNTWLCDFCPVTSIYAQKRNAKRGDYDKQ